MATELHTRCTTTNAHDIQNSSNRTWYMCGNTTNVSQNIPQILQITTKSTIKLPPAASPKMLKWGWKFFVNFVNSYKNLEIGTFKSQNLNHSISILICAIKRNFYVFSTYLMPQIYSSNPYGWGLFDPLQRCCRNILIVPLNIVWFSFGGRGDPYLSLSQTPRCIMCPHHIIKPSTIGSQMVFSNSALRELCCEQCSQCV